MFSGSTPKRITDSDDWLKSFTLPIQFSVRTMTAITSENGIVTQKSRTEIIQTLAGEIWRHTKYPSSNAYNIVCTRLITKFPNLADDDEPGYVSNYKHVYIACVVSFMLLI